MAVPFLQCNSFRKAAAMRVNTKCMDLPKAVQQVLFSLLQPSQIVGVLGILHCEFTVGIDAMVVVGQEFKPLAVTCF